VTASARSATADSPLPRSLHGNRVAAKLTTVIIFIWSGLGYLVAAITFAACLLMNLALDATLGKGYYSAHAWAVGAALILGGLASAFAGFVLKSRDDREVIDVQTGERLIVNQSHHSLFFVPMHWAGMAIAFIGFGIAVYDVVM
jgi:hypothetical protein